MVEKRYRCLTGHEIDAVALEEETEVVTLDDGAKLRLCREHGAPIAITSEGERERVH